MGSNCSADEREFRYLTFHQAIYAIDNDIKKEISNTDISNKKYLLFGLVNQGLFKKYKFLSNENFDKNEARKTKFDYKDLIKKMLIKNLEIFIKILFLVSLRILYLFMKIL